MPLHELPFSLRLDAEERRQLDALAAQLRLSRGEVMRRALELMVRVEQPAVGRAEPEEVAAA